MEVQKIVPYPHLSIGDGDSLKRPVTFLFPQKRTFTDLEGFIDYLPDQINTIYAFGFSGGRFDHQAVVTGNFF